MITPKILIAHAPGEEHHAEKISRHLESHGFMSLHRGTVLVGDSVVADASWLLERQSPVVLCGTVRAVGTGWARRIVQAAQDRGIRIYPLQVEKDAYLNDLLLNQQILSYWQDEERGLEQLVTALRVHFPTCEAKHMPQNNLEENLQEFEEQKRRVEQRIRKHKGEK